MDHQKLVSEFISRTGGDSSIAKKVLEEHRWQLESAITSYRIVHTAALPPVGPRKNQEPSQQLQTSRISAATTGGSTVTLRNNTSPNSTLEHKTIDRKLKRGLSKTTDNVQLVTRARESVLQDISEGRSGVAGFAPGPHSNDSHGQGRGQTQPPHFVDTPEYTFILPDLTKFPEDFRAFIHKDLIETATLVSLEQAGRLNWWADLGACNRLLPLATTGDGNCLLHAASLGMWGFHDRQLTLRTALYNALSSGVVKGSFYRRWRWQQTQTNKQSGLILSESEWQSEWSAMLKLASTTPRTQPGSNTSCCDSVATNGLMERSDKERPAQPEESEVFYESLEEFHVFVLAHVLRRPIIVVADTVLKNCDGEALAPIPFGGVYLPLECQPKDCHRSPLTLTYDAAHFSALVPMEDGGSSAAANHTAAIPVVDPELSLLPIHFLVDPGEKFIWNKNGSNHGNKDNSHNLELSTEEKLGHIHDYLDLTKVALPVGTSTDGGSDSSDAGSRPRSNSWSGPKAPLYRSVSVESTESSHSHSSSHSNTHSNNNMHSNSNTQIHNINHGNNSNSLHPNQDLAPKNGTVNGTVTSKKDKKKEKERVKANSKQMQNVVKSFGSLGKTMSKKLKNLGGLKGVSKGEDMEEKKRTRKPSVGSATQSTKTSSSLTAELLKDRDHVLCARLLHKRLDYQDEMVRNYLDAARDSFQQDRERRRLQDEEMRAEAERRRREQETPSDCINPGCDGIGTPATSYLCEECFARQRQEAMDLENTGNKSGNDSPDGDAKNTVIMRNLVNDSRNVQSSRTSNTDFQRQNTLVNLGSSKFYTYADEDQSLPPPKYFSDVSNNILRNSDSSLNNYGASVHSKVDKAPLELSRSSFYDKPMSGQVRTKLIKAQPGTAVIINNLRQTEGHHDNILPRQHEPYRQNAVQELSAQNHYAPKVSNTLVSDRSVHTDRAAHVDRALHMDRSTPVTHADRPSHMSPKCPSTGRYVSRIQVDSPPPPQPCRNQQCSSFGSETTDFYCDNCYRLYDRDRTTFL